MSCPEAQSFILGLRSRFFISEDCIVTTVIRMTCTVAASHTRTCYGIYQILFVFSMLTVLRNVISFVKLSRKEIEKVLIFKTTRTFKAYTHVNISPRLHSSA